MHRYEPGSFNDTFTFKVDESDKARVIEEIITLHGINPELEEFTTFPLLELWSEVILQCEIIENAPIRFKRKEGVKQPAPKDGEYTDKEYIRDITLLGKYITSILYYAGHVFVESELRLLEFSLNQMVADVWYSHGGSARWYPSQLPERISRTAVMSDWHKSLNDFFMEKAREKRDG